VPATAISHIWPWPRASQINGGGRFSNAAALSSGSALVGAFPLGAKAFAATIFFRPGAEDGIWHRDIYLAALSRDEQASVTPSAHRLAGRT